MEGYKFEQIEYLVLEGRNVVLENYSFDNCIMNGNISRDDFDHWVFIIDDDLEDFLSSKYFDSNQLEKLNFSTESLDSIEQWILERYKSTDEIKKSDNATIVDKIVKYVGETFRKNLSGIWDIDLTNPDNIYYQLPVITNYYEKSTPICPHTLVSATTDRRSGRFLRAVLENAISRKVKK